MTTTYDINDPQVKVTQLYSAFLNRVPEPAGLTAWTQALSSGRSTGAVADDIFAAEEARQICPDPSNHADIVTAIYQNLLGRAPDAEGLAYWTGRLDLGRTPGDVLVDLIAAVEGYTGTDATALASQAMLAQRVADGMHALTVDAGNGQDPGAALVPEAGAESSNHTGSDVVMETIAPANDGGNVRAQPAPVAEAQSADSVNSASSLAQADSTTVVLQAEGEGGSVAAGIYVQTPDGNAGTGAQASAVADADANVSASAHSATTVSTAPNAQAGTSVSVSASAESEAGVNAPSDAAAAGSAADEPVSTAASVVIVSDQTGNAASDSTVSASAHTNGSNVDPVSSSDAGTATSAGTDSEVVGTTTFLAGPIISQPVLTESLMNSIVDDLNAQTRSLGTLDDVFAFKIDRHHDDLNELYLFHFVDTNHDALVQGTELQLVGVAAANADSSASHFAV